MNFDKFKKIGKKKLTERVSNSLEDLEVDVYFNSETDEYIEYIEHDHRHKKHRITKNGQIFGPWIED